jgi:hypothetical protein
LNLNIGLAGVTIIAGKLYCPKNISLNKEGFRSIPARNAFFVV